MALAIDNLITGIIERTDEVILRFVQESYTNLVSNNQTEITLMMTLFIMFIGMRGIHQGFALVDVFKPILALSIVYIFATNWEMFFKFIYNIFTKEPTHIINSFAIPNNGNGNYQTVTEGLETLFAEGYKSANGVMSLGAWNSWLPYIWGIAIHVVNVLSTGFALFLIIYAKFATALLLFLGPVFILTFLFSATRNLFEKWLQQLTTYALIPIITCGILFLTMTISDETMATLAHAPTSTRNIAQLIMPFIFFQLITFFFYLQVMTKAAALGGGLSIASIEHAAGFVAGSAGRVMNNTGISSLAARGGFRAKGLAENSVNAVRNHFSNRSANKVAQHEAAIRRAAMGGLSSGSKVLVSKNK